MNIAYDYDAGRREAEVLGEKPVGLTVPETAAGAFY
jgi:hypothetical protein